MLVNEVADIGEFRKRMQPVYEKYLVRVGGQGMIDKVQAVK
jgi:hypothetical protein